MVLWLKYGTGPDNETLITVGRIGRPHGVSGAVIVLPLTDFPERFSTGSRFHVCDPASPDDGCQGARPGPRRVLEVASAQMHKGRILMTFEGVDDRAAAEELKNHYLKVGIGDLANIPDGHFFIFQLIGLRCIDTEGRHLGSVSEVLSTGSNDVYIVRGREGELLVPAMKSVVSLIDIDEGVIVVRPVDEWGAR